MIAQRVRIIKTGETGTVSEVTGGDIAPCLYTITLDRQGDGREVVKALCYGNEIEPISHLDSAVRSLVEALGLICATYAVTGELERQIAERKKLAGLN